MGNQRVILLAVLFVVLMVSCVHGKRKRTRPRRNNKANCGPPDEVENAELVPRFQGETSFNHSTHVWYRCKEGTRTYQINTKRRCRNGDWTEPKFTCDWITCQNLQAPRNGKRLDVNNEPNELTEFTCDEGYQMIGSPVLRCLVGGDWTPESAPTCQAVTCPRLYGIAHGEMFQESPDGIRDDFGSVVTYTCEKFYDIEGPATRRCMANGQWEGDDPRCVPSSCPKMRPFKNGEVTYNKNPIAVATIATFKCDPGADLIPDVTHATCMPNQEWDRTPSCNRQLQINERTGEVYEIEKEEYSYWNRRIEYSYQRINNGTAVKHDVKVRLRCKSAYELFGSGRFLAPLWYSLSTNKDGVWKPELATCKPERCDVPTTSNGRISYAEESLVQRKLLDGTNITIICDEGYEITHGQTVNTCSKGLLYVPTCTAKPCPVPSDPPEFTMYIPSQGTVKHDAKMTVQCYNDGYELVTENKRKREKYHSSFAAQCQLGQFVGELAFCKEKRCATSDLDDYGYHSKTGDSGRDISDDYLASGSKVTVSCDKNNQFEGLPDLNSTTVTCNKGKFLDAISCQPKPCFRPRVENAYNGYAGKEIGHLESETIKCKPGYEFSDGADTIGLTCHFGKFKQEVPSECIEKSCDLSELYGYNYKSLKNERLQPVTTLASGYILTVTCMDGYHLQDNTTEVTVDIRCDKGVLKGGTTCEPKACELPDEVLNGVTKHFDIYDTGIISHGVSVEVTCNDGFEITKGESSRSVKCHLGDWVDGFPFECFAKKCIVSYDLGNFDEMEVKGVDGNNVSLDDTLDSGAFVVPECKKGFEPRAGQALQISCDHGNWTDIFDCVVRNCSTPDLVEGTMYYWPRMNRLLPGNNVSSGEEVKVNCADGYKIEGSENQDSEAGFKCEDGEWNQTIACVPKTCELYIREGTTYFVGLNEVKHNTVLEHDDKVSISCGEDYELTDDTNKATNETYFVCQHGTFDKRITCEKEKCHLTEIKHGEVRLDGQLYTKPYITVGQQIKVYCNKGYRIAMGSRIIEKFLTRCRKGNQLTRALPVCQRLQGSEELECRYPSKLDYSVYVNETKVLDDDYAGHGTEVEVVCNHRRWSKMTTCLDGKWNPEIPECEKPKTTTTIEPDTGCRLPDSPKYKFEGGALKSGHRVEEGSRTKIDCVSNALEFYYELYEDLYGGEQDEPTYLLCQDGKFVNFNESLLNCPEVLSAKCDQLENGEVKEDLGKISVSCNTGYDLNIPKYDNNFKCEADGLVTKRTDRRPECTPENCTLPMTIRGMQVEVFPRPTPPRFLSAFTKVAHLNKILVNCTHGGNEPNNRKFRCEAGQWYDDEADWNVETHLKNWTTGAFPECREAVCEPPCENSGTCIRDDKCKCLTGTEGERCERFTCPDLCMKNGGVCNTSNLCTCPKDKYGSDCELLLSEPCKQQIINGAVKEDAGRISITCKLGYTLTTPSDDDDFVCAHNLLLSVPSHIEPVCKSDGCKRPILDENIITDNIKESYEPREWTMQLRCKHGYRQVGDANLYCQQGGFWVGEASCEKIKRTKYRIRVTTMALNIAGSDAGTNADVFLTLLGENGHASDEIELTLELDGHPNKFEEGDTDVFEEDFIDVGKVGLLNITD